MQSVEKTRAALNALEIGLGAKFTQEELENLNGEGFNSPEDFWYAKEDDFKGLIRQARRGNLRPYFKVPGSPSRRHPLTKFCSQQLTLKSGKVKRLLEGEDCVGTAAHVSTTLLVTARHCVVDSNGHFGSVHLGNNKPLAFVAASPLENLALLEIADEEDKCMDPFRLYGGLELEVGREIGLLAYPLAWDQEAGGKDVQPYWGYGRVSAAEDLAMATGTYVGTLPDSPGGVVMSDPSILIGVQVSSFWHELPTISTPCEAKFPLPYELDVNSLQGWPSQGEKGGEKTLSCEAEVEDTEKTTNGLTSELQQLEINREASKARVTRKSSTGVMATGIAVFLLLEAADREPRGFLSKRFVRTGHTRKRGRVSS